ncbi:Chitoporin precursor [Vibrio thalassae]|uniref:Chitoporin n=1 Tax=Vibrio thalassae TaxID=1243014 RepID=A0A240EFM4_9VIBR|nr:porin [Vibrio thalassae]SNX47356.1 Chitoporin precursor [Vibrio thalassae]
MEKMFRRTLIGAAVASMVSFSAMADEGAGGQVGINSDFDVEVYGVAAISAVNYNVTDNKDDSAGFAIENESRIGFRASGDMTDSIRVTMQIESGYVDNTDWAHGGVSGGVLGFRDTFIGLSGDFGNVRIGRVLTPLYEIVDWPFSNPGLGSVFDWGGINAHYDRQSNQVRYDSPKFGGFTFAASVGRDDNANGGGAATRDAYFAGANARYAFEKITLMGAVETGKRPGSTTPESWQIAQEAGTDDNGDVYNPGDSYYTKASTTADTDTLAYIVGFEAALPAGFGLAAAYKNEQLKQSGVTHDQGSYSVIGQYWNGPIGFKLGYAANLDSKKGGVSQDDAESTISGQLMAVVNGFVPYVRVAQRTTNIKDSTDNRSDIVTRVGLEYGF